MNKFLVFFVKNIRNKCLISSNYKNYFNNFSKFISIRKIVFLIVKTSKRETKKAE